MPVQAILIQNAVSFRRLGPVRNEPYPTVLREFQLWPKRLPSFH